ncbi:MAG TPA: hypothetical protein VHU40_21425, partial [Polyangia bacterium]|nr:hypothetical protein [Polyangia bacterium]
MSTVSSVGGSSGGSYTPQTLGISAATALTLLKKNPSLSVTISDSTQNIVKNLDALQKVSSKITSLTTTDANKKMTVTATQYQNDGAILAKFGAGSGQTIGVTGMKASSTASLASYVASVTVLDTTSNLSTNLDRLQTLSTSGILTEVQQAGAQGNLTVTAAQLVADAGVLSKFKNGAYTLAVTGATVSDALGLGSNPALGTNAKVKSIAIVDNTTNIHDHLDELQRIGLKVKSIAQTDVATTLNITGAQYTQDKLVLGKFITADHLALQDAAVGQLNTMHADHKVVSIAVADTAANLSKNWALLQNLASSLTSVKVTNQTAAISITGDQLNTGATLLGKFEDTQSQTYKLAVTAVSASSATTIAANQHVTTMDISDTGANVAASMDDLQTVDAAGKLNSITLGSTAATKAMSMDVSRLKGNQLNPTQAILDKIKRGGYQLSITGASAADLTDLAANRRVSAITVADSSTNIKGALSDLAHLGGRLTAIE